VRSILVSRAERRTDRERRKRRAASDMDMRSYQATRDALARASMRAVAETTHPAA
jgi:hypothetical protein